jgi:hypothetical protein
MWSAGLQRSMIDKAVQADLDKRSEQHAAQVGQQIDARRPVRATSSAMHEKLTGARKRHRPVLTDRGC